MPRRVAHLVCEAIKLFDNAQVATARSALPQLRIFLDSLADYFSDRLTPRQVLAVRKAYHVIKYPDNQVTQDMLDKDMDAINSPGIHNVLSQFTWIKLGLESIGTLPKFVGRPADLAPVSYLKSIDSRYVRTREQQVNRWANVYRRNLAIYAGLPMHLKSFHRWSDVFANSDFREVSHLPEDSENSGSVGNVDFRFEQGMKVRLFASPHLLFQAYLEPMKRYCQRVCRAIPEDFHGDQPGGRFAVQQELRKGTMCYSFDLSAATHRFPWELQRKMLNYLPIPHDYREILDYVSTGEFNSRFGTISWKSGQPLGTGPSFFVFSLCHHLIVRGIFSRLGIDPRGGYAILGDDIVIFNTRVAKAYKKVMTSIGCVINTSKSVVSSDVAEFAGAYIDREHVINVGKFKSVHAGNEFDYALTWDNSDIYPDITSYLKGESDPLVSDYVHLYLCDKSGNVINIDRFRYPSAKIKQLNSALAERDCLVSLNPQAYDDEIRLVAREILGIFNDCPECFPDAVTPHLLSQNMIALEGFRELFKFYQLDISVGPATPIWWVRFCQLTGCNPETFSVTKLVRCIGDYLRSKFFGGISRTNMTNRYNRTLKKAFASYHRLIAEDPSGDTVREKVNDFKRTLSYWDVTSA